MVLLLADVLNEMIKRGQEKEALLYQFDILFNLGLIHGFSEEKIMSMTIDEIGEFMLKPPRPLKYHGWDTFYWGESAFAKTNN